MFKFPFSNIVLIDFPLFSANVYNRNSLQSPVEIVALAILEIA